MVYQFFPLPIRKMENIQGVHLYVLKELIGDQKTTPFSEVNILDPKYYSNKHGTVQKVVVLFTRTVQL